MGAEVDEEELLRSVPIRVTDDGGAWELVQMGAVARLGSVALQVRHATVATRGSVSGSEMSVESSPRAALVQQTAVLALLSARTPSVGSAAQSANAPLAASAGSTATDAAGQATVAVNCSAVKVRFYVSGRLDESTFDMLNNTALAFNWYKRPYVHVFVVHYTSLNSGSTKDAGGGARARLKQFVDTCVERKVAYLILFVASLTPPNNSASATTSQRRFFTTSSQDPEAEIRAARRVFDKLRSIANVVRNRENCVFLRAPTAPAASAAALPSPASPQGSRIQLDSILGENKVSQVQTAELSDPPAHALDFLQRLRELVTEALQARVAAYEDEIERVYANRMLPGWSFFTYFALKESLNFVYRQVGCFELALFGYDALEEMVHERHTALGAPSFVSDGQLDDSASGLMDVNAKDYRRRVYESVISEMDFRVYLFARQNELLILLKLLPELSERGLNFIEHMSAMIAERVPPQATSLGSSFRDAWVFSASRQLAAELEAKVRGAEIDEGVLVEEKFRRTARLVAGFHVTALQAFSQLCAAVQHGPTASVAESDPHALLDAMPAWGPEKLSRNVPDSPGAEHSAAQGAQGVLAGRGRVAQSPRALQQLLSNPELQRALRSPAASEQLFTELAFAAASLFELGGRVRGAAALGGEAGVMRLQSGSHTQAESLLSLQCARYLADDGWDALHHRSRAALALAEKTLGKVQEFLLSCLAMLTMYRERRRQRLRADIDEAPHEESRSNCIEPERATSGHAGKPFREIGIVEDAARWAAEAAEAAARLPRVMKYKLDRLVDASMLPQHTPWIQGNPAFAVVVINSDIPATLRFDSLAVELRHIPAAIEPSSSSNSTASSPASQSRGAQSAGSSNTGSLFALTHRDAIEIRSGRNEVKVEAQEVPSSGKYEVSLVVLYLGKLKLVQIAEPWRDQVDACGTGACMSAAGVLSSIEDQISDSGTASGKRDAVQTATIDIPPFSKPHGVEHSRAGLLMRFPSYFATGHERSFVVRVLPQHVLLAPYVVQYVSLELEAGKTGVEAGATLSLVLQLAQNQTYVSEVTLVDTAANAFSASDLAAVAHDPTDGVPSTAFASAAASIRAESEMLRVQSGGFGCNRGTATLAHALAPNEKKLVFLAIAFGALAPQSLAAPSGALIDARLEIECVLNVEVRGRSIGPPAFHFRHRSFGAMRVSSVILVSASVVHHAVSFKKKCSAPTQGQVTANHSVAEDDDKSGYTKNKSSSFSGLLLCEVEASNAIASLQRLTLCNATLELQPPYTLSEGAAALHTLVLPCALNRSAPFSLCFGFEHVRATSENLSTINHGQGAKSAILRFELEAEKVDGRIIIERSIPLYALDCARSYIVVERKALQESTVGVPLGFAFRVHIHEPQRSGVECATSVKYEVDADESTWLVVGKSRAQALISARTRVADGAGIVRKLSSRWTRLKLVGMQPGRHALPKIRLCSFEGVLRVSGETKQSDSAEKVQQSSCGDVPNVQLMLANIEYQDTRSSVCIYPEQELGSTCFPVSLPLSD